MYHISQEQIGTTFFNCAMWAGIWSNIISFFYGREDVSTHLGHHQVLTCGWSMNMVNFGLSNESFVSFAS